ncbi:MAG: hypothetical protein HY590_00280 [Candidatus Omnitrophica bacterium]|nr:hypothetical protein [Candidatus Omnitrophota bacterium]
MKKTPFLVACFLSLGTCAFAEEFIIHKFDKRSNVLGGASSVYQQAPSRAVATVSAEVSHDPGGKALKLDYDKKGVGGPYGKGGWCGFYTRVKIAEKHLDASHFKILHFWVKGAKGDENFRIGISDRHWDELDDTVKSEDVGTYLPEGKITTDWQRASIPLDVFGIDLSEIAAIAICFETECFPGGAGQGSIYIDDLMLE